MANNLKVMVFVGKRDTKKKDGTVVKRDVYSVMKLESLRSRDDRLIKE